MEKSSIFLLLWMRIAHECAKEIATLSTMRHNIRISHHHHLCVYIKRKCCTSVDTNAVDAAGKAQTWEREREWRRRRGRKKYVNIQQINYRKSFEIATLLLSNSKRWCWQRQMTRDAIVYAHRTFECATEMVNVKQSVCARICFAIVASTSVSGKREHGK